MKITIKDDDFIEISTRSAKALNRDFTVDFSIVAIFILTFYMSTVFVYKSIIGSFKLQMVIVIISLLFLLLDVLKVRKRIWIFKSDLLWLLSLIPFLASIRGFWLRGIADMIIYSSCIMFLIMSKVSIDKFQPSIRLIKIASIVYALSTVIQYYFMDEYMRLIYPLFSIYSQIDLDKTLSNGLYAGLTNQVAFTAGYIINGFGVIFCFWRMGNRRQKIIDIVYIFILFIGLMLTGKRAHTLFMIISLLLTYYCSGKREDRKNQILKTLLIMVLITVGIFFISQYVEMANAFQRLTSTITNLLKGEDVTSGRSTLYKQAWEMFLSNPFWGIGWRQFKEHSLGLISDIVESDVHNVYLQLLCETGIFGLIFFVIAAFHMYYKTYKLVIKVNQKGFVCPPIWRSSIHFSFYSQTFFLLYCLVGNPLYDFSFLVMYFLACAISGAFIAKFKEMRVYE